MLLTFALAHGKNIPIEKIPKREPAVMPARLFPACGNKCELNNSRQYDKGAYVDSNTFSEYHSYIVFWKS
jgi:hypothetical protein